MIKLKMNAATVVITLVLSLNSVALLKGCGGGGGSAGDNNAASNRGTGGSSSAQTPTPAASPVPKGSEPVNPDNQTQIQTLSLSQYSDVEEPFVYVARDAESYRALREVVTNLPEKASEFFDAHAVVAAFLGTRPTGGFGVTITQPASNIVKISEQQPPKDAMTTQALTAPYAVVAVPVAAGSEGVSLELEKIWSGAMRAFQVREGTFTVTGGIAGRKIEFKLEGSVRLFKQRRLVTLEFDLKGAGEASGRTLRTVASGVGGQGGQFQLQRFMTGSLVEPPNGGLRATGQMTNAELTLTFQPVAAPRVADGFDGAGQLKAVANTIQK